MLNAFIDFSKKLKGFDGENLFLKEVIVAGKILSREGLSWIAGQKGKNKFSATELTRFDYSLRTVFEAVMKKLLETIYRLDVFIAVRSVAAEKNFCIAEAKATEENIFAAVNVKHPCLNKATGNDICIHEDKNLVFLTGANMAGKSTFMKSVGVAVYLAHMGFPIAADKLAFSVRDGLYTSINVPDDLNMGYSHFYAEVLRVKHVAREVMKPLRLVIIFDELFKGTNVKDAYDATLAVSGVFAEKGYCFFIISTHITEAREALKVKYDNIRYVYFPSLLKGNIPVYTYQLQEGISRDKHGMHIIRKEGILELIAGR